MGYAFYELALGGLFIVEPHSQNAPGTGPHTLVGSSEGSTCHMGVYGVGRHLAKAGAAASTPLAVPQAPTTGMSECASVTREASPSGARWAASFITSEIGTREATHWRSSQMSV